MLTSSAWQEFRKNTQTSNLSDKTLHPLLDLSLIAVEGPDSERFLQGQVTCDVSRLSAEKASVGALCDAKGRMQVTFLLMKHEQTYFFVIPAEALTHTLQRLKKYALFSNVRFHEATSWCLCGLHDKTQPPHTEMYSVHTSAPSLFTVTWPGDFKRSLILSMTSEPIITLCQNFFAHTYLMKDASSWKQENISHGLAEILPVTSGLFIPQMINLQNRDGVSFKKGCYVGQEIIARTQHLGKLKRHLYLIHLENTPAPGDSITNENQEPLGTILNSGLDHLHLAVLEERSIHLPTLFWQQQPIQILKRYPLLTK